MYNIIKILGWIYCLCLLLHGMSICNLCCEESVRMLIFHTITRSEIIRDFFNFDDKSLKINGNHFKKLYCLPVIRPIIKTFLTKCSQNWKLLCLFKTFKDSERNEECIDYTTMFFVFLYLCTCNSYDQKEC